MNMREENFIDLSAPHNRQLTVGSFAPLCGTIGRPVDVENDVHPTAAPNQLRPGR